MGTYAAAKYEKLSITCYYPATIAKVCAGGGDFDRISDTGLTCRQEADGAYIIQDGESGTGTQCFQRQNFGLDGVVDARQCGVIGDGLPAHGLIGDADFHPDDGARLNGCLTNAPPKPIYHIVSTGGGVIRDDTGDITIGDDMTLTCGGRSVSAVNNNDYRILDPVTLTKILSKAIVIDPTDHAGTRYTVRLTGKNSALSGCTVEAGEGPVTGGIPANPWSPSIWYPNCAPPPDSTPVSCDDSGGQASLRSVMLEASAFIPNATNWYTSGGPAAASAGVTLDSASNAAVRDLTILGFGTCLLLGNPSTDTAAPGAVVDDIQGDCNTGVEVHKSNQPTFSNMKMGPLLGESTISVWTIESIADDGSGHYLVTAKSPDTFKVKENDTVWVGTGIASVAGGRESARGRWIISTVNDVSCPPATCQSFVLSGSRSTSFSINANVSNVVSAGVPPTALTGVATTDPNLRYLSPGQQVTGSCIAAGTTVIAVWPWKGIVYISAPPTCTPSSNPASITFTDNSYPTAPAGCDEANTQFGCMFFDAGFRFGDGFDVHNTGGASFVNCSAGEHMVAFHANTGSNKTRFVNCETGNNVQLPDGNLWAMNAHASDDDNDDRQNIVGLLIDGKHVSPPPTPPAADADACDTDVTNVVLGQHRPVAIVENTLCDHSQKIANVELSVDDNQGTAIGFELDRGSLTLVNSGGTSADNFVSSDGSLAISNNKLEGMSLYAQNASAAGAIVGCGNVFKMPTGYLCTPSPATMVPGGRLALTANCTPSQPPTPVMTSDVVNGACIFYLPYRGQQVPIYNPSAAGFGLFDIGPGGIKLNLDSTSTNKQANRMLYDIFVETVHTGSPELCTGPAWSTNVTRSILNQQLQGIWVNANTLLQCQYDVGNAKNFACPPAQCTYLGTIYMTADGRTSQQFGPDAHANGNGNCLCLYNAYNRVPVMSMSLDSNLAYNYGNMNWRPMDPHTIPPPATGLLTDNSITVVDGLGEMGIAAELGDLLKGVGGASPAVPRIALVLNSTSGPPVYYASNQATTAISVSAPLRNPPLIGVWYVQAVEATSTSNTATFGGPNQQQVSVHLDD